MYLGQMCGRKRREAKAHGVGQRESFLPIVLARSAQDGADLVQLVNLRRAWSVGIQVELRIYTFLITPVGLTGEERPLRVQFCSDAADCPNIYRRIVAGRSE